MPEREADDPEPKPASRWPGVAGLETAVRPFQRTGRYYARMWRDYLGDRGSEEDLPVARPTMALATEAFRDEVVLLGLRGRRPVSDPEAFQRIDREVSAAIRFYDKRGFLAAPEKFFAAPPPLTDVTVLPRQGRLRRHDRIRWESGYAPRKGEPGGPRWRSYTANDRAYAVMLRHHEPRPWLVGIHGAEMGRAGIDLWLFRARHLHEKYGLNIVLPVLPMHGPRARDLPAGAVFPSEDVMDTLHAGAQGVWDVRRLISWIRAQEPDQPIGLNSISMGGYIAGLVASVEDDLTCAILGVPVVDVVQLLGRHSGLSRTDPRWQTVALAEPLGRMASPLSMTPRVPMRGRFIYAGIADRVVHPREQVVRLWEHWGKPEIVWYRGGHTGFFQARPVQRFVEAAIVQSGLLD
ncbi:alpha/beta hydrolase family protein [Mycolicibacillus parakoreensis]|uniref:Alpha/beta hydrolase n=1 Tax=Mycolicibacillus parakoreensis TaxID=1069221 RepID=A0ABY3U2K4_9MYCO|nr:hypothetical protein [Mycolicibacillus parakoreensis]ULN53732.1 hypothetical protein MIU77_05330 [Mycolicibacillus parakoreensis]